MFLQKKFGEELAGQHFSLKKKYIVSSECWQSTRKLLAVSWRSRQEEMMQGQDEKLDEVRGG